MKYPSRTEPGTCSSHFLDPPELPETNQGRPVWFPGDLWSGGVEIPTQLCGGLFHQTMKNKDPVFFTPQYFMESLSLLFFSSPFRTPGSFKIFTNLKRMVCLGSTIEV